MGDRRACPRAVGQARGRERKREAVAEGIANEIALAQAEVKNARAVLEAADVTLEADQEGYRVATESFRLGQITATYLADAESDLLNARLALLHGRIDLTPR